MSSSLTDRQLFDLMWQASWKATEAALAAGHKRGSKVVKDSAYRAAEEVYRRERPDEAPAPRPIPLPFVVPATGEVLDDPAKERMDV
jgi:hypothetical protein